MQMKYDHAITEQSLDAVEAVLNYAEETVHNVLFIQHQVS